MKALSENKVLQNIDLSHNHMKMSSATAMLNLLKVNNVIKKINLEGNVIQAPLLMKIKQGLNANIKLSEKLLNEKLGKQKVGFQKAMKG